MFSIRAPAIRGITAISKTFRQCRDTESELEHPWHSQPFYHDYSQTVPSANSCGTISAIPETLPNWCKAKRYPPGSSCLFFSDRLELICNLIALTCQTTGRWRAA